MEDDKISTIADKNYHVMLRRADGTVIDPCAVPDASKPLGASEAARALARRNAGAVERKKIGAVQMTTGLVLAPFDSQVINAMTEAAIELYTTLPLAPPYRLALDPADAVLVLELRLGNVSLLSVPSPVAGSFLYTPIYMPNRDPVDIGALQRALPLDGPAVPGGTKVVLRVKNISCTTIELYATLLGMPGQTSLGQSSLGQSQRAALGLPLTPSELDDRELARNVEARADARFKKEHDRRLAHLKDKVQTVAFIARRAEPVDGAEDAAWESPHDEWP